jgi:4-azaleucine resistance transporter AzlC
MKRGRVTPRAGLKKGAIWRYHCTMRGSICARALRCSLPVLAGYLAIGFAFGLLAAEAGYPWYVAFLMSVVMYAGAGQYIAIGHFAAGTALPEMIAVQAAVNARHIAYGVTMLQRFRVAGRYKPYLIFALTDETFAVLSSLDQDSMDERERSRLMFAISLFDHLYWIAGTLAGFFCGLLLPAELTGVDFALIALFIVLLIEQAFRVKKAAPFLIPAIAAAAATFLPQRMALLAALAFSIAALRLLDRRSA